MSAFLSRLIYVHFISLSTFCRQRCSTYMWSAVVRDRKTPYSLLSSQHTKETWYFWQCGQTEQTEIAILPARTRGLGRLGGIVGSSLRYVYLYVEIWISLGQHSFELLTIIFPANFVIFVYRHLAANFCVPLPLSWCHCSWFQQAGYTFPFSAK